MEEVFKDIKDFEGLYKVSNLGNVYGNNKIIDFNNGKGYRILSLRKEGVNKSYKVHRLVAQAFLGLDINDKNMLVCHKDDNPNNNCVDNLFLGTNYDNMQDMVKKGRNKPTRNYGESNGAAKINKEIVIHIRSSLNNKLKTAKVLSNELNLSIGHIYDIKNKRRWGHI